MNLLFFVITLMILALVILFLPRRKGLRSSSSVRVAPKGFTSQEAEVSSVSSIAEIASPQCEDESAPLLPEFNYTTIAEGTIPRGLTDSSAHASVKSSWRIADLPTLPASSLELDRLLRDPNSSAKDITALVSTNPMLSARLLKAINSAFFNMPEKVTSVGRAIVLMGYNNVRAVVMYDSLRSLLSSSSHGSRSLRDKIWAHSTVVSASAHYISQDMLHSIDHEMATIGLLHDIGKYFLGLPSIHQPTDENTSMIAQEVESFGINHAVLGGIIVEHWDLSERIANCIAYHHHPAYVSPEEIPESHRRSTAIVYLADLVCRVLGYGGDHSELLPMRDEYYEMLGMKPDLSSVVKRGLVREAAKAHATVQSFIAGC